MHGQTETYIRNLEKVKGYLKERINQRLFIPINQEDMSMTVGLSRSSLTRMLRHLEDDDIIEVDRNRMPYQYKFK